MTYGQILKKKRKELGLRLEDVARRIRTTKGYVSGIENGKVNPPSPIFTARLAKVLDLDPEYLMCLAHAEKAPRLVRDGFIEFVTLKFVIAPAHRQMEPPGPKAAAI